MAKIFQIGDKIRILKNINRMSLPEYLMSFIDYAGDNYSQGMLIQNKAFKNHWVIVAEQTHGRYGKVYQLQGAGNYEGSYRPRLPPEFIAKYTQGRETITGKLPRFIDKQRKVRVY